MVGVMSFSIIKFFGVDISMLQDELLHFTIHKLVAWGKTPEEFIRLGKKHQILSFPFQIRLVEKGPKYQDFHALVGRYHMYVYGSEDLSVSSIIIPRKLPTWI